MKKQRTSAPGSELDNTVELVHDFHMQHPEKPGPLLLLPA